MIMILIIIGSHSEPELERRHVQEKSHTGGRRLKDVLVYIVG